jgi:hypothetical protein
MKIKVAIPLFPRTCDIKFHQTQSTSSQVDTCGWKDRHDFPFVHSGYAHHAKNVRKTG